MKNTKFRVKEAFKADFGKSIVRIDPEIILKENLNTGDIVSIFNNSGMKSTGAYLFPSDLKDKGTRIIRIDAILRRNLKVSINDVVKIKRTNVKSAQQVSLAGYQKEIMVKKPNLLAKKLRNKLVSKGDIFSFRSGNKKVDLVVVNHTPETDVVIINEDTAIYSQTAVGES